MALLVPPEPVGRSDHNHTRLGEGQHGVELSDGARLHVVGLEGADRVGRASSGLDGPGPHPGEGVR